MSEDTTEPEEEPKKASKLPIILGFVLALVFGGAGFYATWSGMILGPAEAEAAEEPQPDTPSDLDIAFIELEPMLVSIGEGSAKSHLRFRAQLEVPSKSVETVTLLQPRVIDVLNAYLRAVSTSDVDDVSALSRLRAQMLRRVKVVLGPEHVNDLLVTEFVFN